MGAPPPVRLGERRTSDVVVRVRTEEGRDERFYCHSDLLVRNSKYFADRLSPEWPTCQILDSRTCVDVPCHERDFDSFVCALRLLYSSTPDNINIPTFPNVRSALGILRVAIDLGCQQLADACLVFLEASPWEEAEEEEILRTVPGLGSQYQHILARLQPIDSSSIAGMFISALRFTTSCPPACMQVLKSSVQEQLEYMLTEDDDAPLLNSSDLFQTEVRKCIGNLTSQFRDLLGFWQNNPATEATLEVEKLDALKSFLGDLSWACRILARIELMKDVVHFWVEVSTKVVQTVKHLNVGNLLAIKLKVVEVAATVLEAIGYGNVILPTLKRLQMVKVWLPFVQEAKEFADYFDSTDQEDDALVRVDEEMWQSLESAFVSIILALPSGDQAVILADWLKDSHIRYPDLSEAFEVWCYRHKVARRRMSLLDGCKGVP